MIPNERFLVTGGNGFLGAWIVRRLLADGAEVASLDIDGDEHIPRQVLPPLDLLSPGEGGRWTRLVGDVSDSTCVERAVGDFAPRAIVHLAGLQVPACKADPVAGARINVLGTLNVFEVAARRSDLVRRVVYASSAAVAGPPEDYGAPVPDEARHEPRTHYGVFKLANEGNAKVYWQDRGVPSVGLRPLTVFGAGREKGLTSGPTKAIKAALLGRAYGIPFTGTTGFHYVEDVAHAFCACARAELNGAFAWNMRGEILDVHEFIGALDRVLPGASSRISAAGPSLPIAFDVLQGGLDRNAGLPPPVSVEEGIRRTVDVFRNLRDQGRLHDRDLES